MPRIKTEALREGMVVSSDVKNIDNMLLIPSGCKLTSRQIGILQAWGVNEIEVATGGEAGPADLLESLDPEVVARMTVEIRSHFWKPDDADPVYAEFMKILLRRRANRPAPKTQA